MIRFGIVGAGWRSEFYQRVARACPEQMQLIGMVGRSPERAQGVAARFGVPLCASLDELARLQPDYVVACVPRAQMLPVLRELAALGLAALAETPPGDTLESLGAVWALSRHGARLQVAEQYWAQPHHAARLALAASGKLGRISQVQVSVCHGYHGMSLLRRFLGVMFEPVTVTATSFTSPLVQGPGRNGPPIEEKIVNSTQVIARFDFGDRLGIYDFLGDMYFSYIRGQRLLVRGERGEIVDERAVYLQDVTTPIAVTFARHSAGLNGNLEGNYLKGIQASETWAYRNPLAPAALSDEEIAIGTCLLRMGDYARGGEPFYGVAEAAQDRYLDLLMERALASGEAVRSEPQVWQS
jgi:hypothetical protein